MISLKGQMIPEDWKKWAINLLKFTAPALAVFFHLLSTGVSIEKAWPVAAFAFYGALSDLFGKYDKETKY